MVIKVYVSGISGNKEVKKRQQRVLMILESKNVDYQVIDITEPDKEAEKEYMQVNSNARESKYPLPPQIFNDEDYCGDYEDFDMANEMDELDKFLKGPNISLGEEKSQNNDVHQNGNSSSRETSADKEEHNNDLNSDERRSSNTLKDDEESNLDNNDDTDKKNEDITDNQQANEE